METERSIEGRSRTRADGGLKVTGEARYAGDVSVPGMCHAVLVQATIARGVVEQIDASVAEASPGVLAVFTHANLPVLQPPPASFTADFPAERRAPLSDATIHYAGQHVAIVLAETLLDAQAAAALIKVIYGPPADGRPATLELTEGLPGTYQPDHFATNDKEKLNEERGERPTTDAAHLLELVYRTPIVHHNPIETSATVAAWQGDRLNLYDSTRWVQGSQKIVSHMLGVPEENVSVIAPFVGGAFGSKGFLWQHVALAAQAARVVGRPVKLVLSRPEMFTSVGHRPRTEQRLLLATDAGGRLQSVEHHTLTETSPVAHFVEPAGMSARNLYSTPHTAISHRVSPVNLATPCFMRAPGESPGIFALESAIDEMAEACGQNPLAFRLHNYAERDEDEDQPHGREWSSKHLRECYARGAERFGWARRSPGVGSMRRAGRAAKGDRGDRLVGWGMATAAYPARRSPATVRGTLRIDGHAHFSAATHEIGTGTTTILEQVAAETLGFPLERVHFALGDSDYSKAPVAGASQTTASVGPAVERVATELRRKLIACVVADARSPLHDVDPARVAIANGVLRAGGVSEPVADWLARQQTSLQLEAEAAAEQDEAAKQQYTFLSFGAHFCEVEIDPRGLDLRVTRWVAAMDCGRILNPMTAASQVRGGILFGLGMALMEQTVYDLGSAASAGLPVNPNLAEYHLPTCADLPEIEVELIEEPDLRFNPLGVRGIGEIGITGVPAAIANAVYHATGKRVRELPLTLDKVFAGLRSRSA